MNGLRKLKRYSAVFHLEFLADPERFQEEAEIIAKYYGGDSFVDVNTILLAEEPTDVSSGDTEQR
jgi:hypothetical protein